MPGRYEACCLRDMRFALLSSTVLACAALVACAPQDDGAVTDDSSELVEGRSALERELSPPIAPPTPAVIGKKTSDAIAEATAGAASAGIEKAQGGCTIERFESATTKKLVAERELCKGSEVVRLLDELGAAKTTWSDLNRDGKIDRFAGEDGAFVLYADANFDGKVDQTIERVDRLKGFSLEGYDESYPTSKFVHRIREDRNKDGKLDWEKLVAKGLLPPAR